MKPGEKRKHKVDDFTFPWMKLHTILPGEAPMQQEDNLTHHGSENICFFFVKPTLEPGAESRNSLDGTLSC